MVFAAKQNPRRPGVSSALGLRLTDCVLARMASCMCTDQRLFSGMMNAVTKILSAIESGEAHASDQLLPLVYEELRRRWMITYDSGSNIGKLYRRQDEIGTPFCITVDGETTTGDTVTIRDRDSLEQIRIPLAITNVRLSPRHLLDVLSIDQQ